MSDRQETAIMDNGGEAVSERVCIAGRWFPVVSIICPQEDDQEERSAYQRSLGARNDWTSYIPAENGVIFAVEVDGREAAQPGALRMHMLCAACERHEDPNDESWMWLPQAVWIDGNGDLVAAPLGEHGMWMDADPEWVAETIDRLSRQPFTMPDGPMAQLSPRLDNGSPVRHATLAHSGRKREGER